jgi:hypothetical protein
LGRTAPEASVIVPSIPLPDSWAKPIADNRNRISNNLIPEIGMDGEQEKSLIDNPLCRKNLEKIDSLVKA